MEPAIFSIDNWMIEFVRYNGITLFAIIGMLKVLAKQSKNTKDDAILTYLGNALGSFRKDKNG